MLTIAVGDVFAARAEARVGHVYAHCISRDCRMGAGIAILFAAKFGRPTLPRREPGARFGFIQDETVLHLITKERAFHKPTKDDFEHALVDGYQRAQAAGVTHIHMPRIGSGLDRLPQAWCQAIVERYAAAFKIDTTIYDLHAA